MMQFLATLASTLALAEAGSGTAAKWANSANLRRHLSFEKVAGYSPNSQVTDHCAIDLDQAAIESQLILKTTESFQNARDIYNKGGNSKSYAYVTLLDPAGLDAPLAKGERIMGKNAEGLEVAGEAYEDYETKSKFLKVLYSTGDIQETYVECQVGKLVETNMMGCLTGEGDLKIGGRQYAYNYVPATDNRNGRTIASFSEGTNAQDEMRLNCRGCPYKDFMYFYNYYGTDEYAHQFVEAAFEGTETQFTNGNADFSLYSFMGKEQIIKKSTNYLNIFMYVIHGWEEALDDCDRGCLDCNPHAVHSWDEGVCYYTGSIEGGPGGTNTGGKLLHHLADKRCADYKTCGVEGTDLVGTAKLNYDIFSLFSVGNFQLLTGNCPAARATTNEITDKMYVPLIQGALRYAYKVGELFGGEKEQAEGAAFAAAVLPRVHAADPGAADTIYQNLKVGATSTDFWEVKNAFQSVYQMMGVSCTDVGGLWSYSDNNYFAGMEPCDDATLFASTKEVEAKSNNALAVILGSVFGGLFVIAIIMLFVEKRRVKQTKAELAVFKTTGDDIKHLN